MSQAITGMLGVNNPINKFFRICDELGWTSVVLHIFKSTLLFLVLSLSLEEEEVIYTGTHGVR